MKRRKSLLVSVVCLILSICMMASPVMAASKDINSKSTKKSSQTVTESVSAKTATSALESQANAAEVQTEKASAQNQIRFQYLRLIKPSMGQTVRKGQKIFVKCNIRDTWKYYYTRPVVCVYNSCGRCVYSAYFGSRIAANGCMYTRYSNLSLNTRCLSKGKYKCVMYAAPCYSSGRLLGNWTCFNLVYDYNYFYIK